MGRMTRAKAAEVAEKLHIDEDAVLELPSESGGVNLTKTPEKDERAPLGEIAPNSSDGREEETEIAELRKSTRGRKAGSKKGGKGKKVNLATSTTSQPDTLGELSEVVPDEKETMSSPASEVAAEDLRQDGPEIDATPETHDDATSDHTIPSAVQSPKAELAMLTITEDVEVEKPDPDTSADNLAEPVEAESTSLHADVENPEQHPELATQIVIDAPASPLQSAIPAVIVSLRKGTSGKRSTSNKENVQPMEAETPVPRTLTPAVPRSHRRSTTYDALEEAVVQGLTPPAGSREPSMMEFPLGQPSPISLEALKESVEDPTTQPSPKAADAPLTFPTPAFEAPVPASPKPEDPIVAMDALEEAVEKVTAEVPSVQATPAKQRTKRVAPVVRTTKASEVRMSLAQTDKNVATKAPAAGRPRPSTMLGRAGSVRQSVATKSEPAGKRIQLGSSKRPEPAAHGEKKETVIPHSKPRPVSLSFPTPPPPPKSKKAPTTSTFQLPGEAVAAKLKAAREERTKKEAEDDEKKPAFKARPVPAGLKKAPSVRQTTASKARVSSMGDKPAPAGGLKRANSVATSSSAASKPRVVSKDASPHSPKALRPIQDRLTVAKRPSTVTANTGKPRTSLATAGPAPASGAAQRVPSKGTTKGKEVFNRAAAAKESAEKEKREKEEAAKKARATASERGRQASREWAEKQRLRKLGLKPETGMKPAAAHAERRQSRNAPVAEAVEDEVTVVEATRDEVAAIA